MKDSVVTFALASVSKRMTVQFSPEGHDVVCALLVRWIDQCAKAYAGAKEMERMTDNPLMKGQALYWQHAGSFLKGKLYGHLSHKFSCYNEIKTLAKLNESGQIPEGWEPLGEPLPIEEPGDATSGVTTGGGGSDRAGADSDTGTGVRLGGADDPGAGDGTGAGRHSSAGGKKAGAKSDGKRKKGTRSDRGRGGQRQPAGDEARSGDGSGTKAVGNRPAPRNRKPGRK